MMATGSDRSGRALATDEEYFPSFLTAAQSTPKADKAKDSTPRARAEMDVFSSKARPRMTFAESLSMAKRKGGVEVPEDSPFGLGDNYMDRLYVRKRKTAATDTPEDLTDEDVPPPPTTSLLDPAGYLGGSHGADDDDAAAAAARRAAASAKAARASYYPSLHGDEWGQDKQYWVTVYGFAASAKPVILHQFQAVGEVVNYTVGGGNWLHVRYHTRLQAEKALSLDGRTLAGNVMIGVKKCYAADREGGGVQDETPVSSYFGGQQQHQRASLGSRDLEVDPSNEADIMLPPRRQQDICSRLLSYLFKW